MTQNTFERTFIGLLISLLGMTIGFFGSQLTKVQKIVEKLEPPEPEQVVEVHTEYQYIMWNGKNAEGMKNCALNDNPSAPYCFIEASWDSYTGKAIIDLHPKP